MLIDVLASLEALTRRTPFNAVADAESELAKLGVLRWVTGIAAIARVAPIAWASAYYFAPGSFFGISDAAIAGAGVLLLLVAATVGFATPLALAGVLWFGTAYDRSLQTDSLGTSLFTLLVALLLLASAGRRFSVDSRLLRGAGRTARIVRFLYRLTGSPSVEQLRALYLLFFLIVGVLNAQALVYHLGEDAWRSGRVLDVVFTSSYMGRFWEGFRGLSVAAPTLLEAISDIGSTGQLIFQALMAPLIFVPVARRIVIWWGTAFFALSIAFLQLSFLPFWELILWAALFWRTDRFRAERGTVAAPIVVRRPGAAALVNGILMCALGLRVIISVPAIERRAPDATAKIARALARLGLEVPQVFNREDLRLGDVWPVLYRIEDDGTPRLLPYHGVNGERLAWVQHVDLFLYPSSLRWRREVPVHDLPRYLAPGSDGAGRLTVVALFDHRRRDAVRTEYRVEYYATRASMWRLPPHARYERRLLGSSRLFCQGRTSAARCEYRTPNE